jgi:hypothetical protein
VNRDAEIAFVLFTGGPPEDWQRAASVLDRASPTLARADATFACRQTGGIVPHALALAEARRVATALSRAGFPAMAVSPDRLVHPPAARPLASGNVLSEGFAIEAHWLRGARLVSWGSIRAIAVGAILAGQRMRPLKRMPRVHTRRAAPPEPPAAMLTREDLERAAIELASLAVSWFVPPVVSGAIDLVRAASRVRRVEPPEPILPSDEEPRRAPRPEGWLELFCADPLARLRVRHSSFLYTGLGESRAVSSRANFVRLVEQVRARLPSCASVGPVDDARGVGRALAGEEGSGDPRGRRGRQPPATILEERHHELRVCALLTRLALAGAL